MMTQKDLIVRLAIENLELRDEVKKQTESSTYWYNKCCELEKASIPVSIESTDATRNQEFAKTEPGQQ
jgi:hypothetical protein